MTNQFCFHKLDHLRKLVELQRIFMYTLCVLYLLFSIVASIGNLTVIYALWKASSMPSTVKKLFLSLAFSDLAVGILSQPMFGVIIAVMLSIAYADRYISYTSFCPTILSVFYFFNFLLSCASFMNVTAIAVDRLLAISLHLRYHEFITSKRVISALVCLWIVSFIVATLFIVLPNGNDMVAAITVCLGLFWQVWHIFVFTKLSSIIRIEYKAKHSSKILEKWNNSDKRSLPIMLSSSSWFS